MAGKILMCTGTPSRNGCGEVHAFTVFVPGVATCLLCGTCTPFEALNLDYEKNKFLADDFNQQHEAKSREITQS